MLKRINDALPGLVFGIIAYGCIIQLVGIWFMKDIIYDSIGLWYGIAIAVGMAIHLATVIFDSVSMGDTKHAGRILIAKSLFRYVMVVVLFFLIGYFQFGNLFLALLGVLGLKLSAYAQPLLRKLLKRTKEEEPCEANDKK